MKIELKLNKDFERTLNNLIEKYGEDFEILNGIHESQTNFSDFIDAFVIVFHLLFKIGRAHV